MQVSNLDALGQPIAGLFQLEDHTYAVTILERLTTDVPVRAAFMVMEVADHTTHTLHSATHHKGMDMELAIYKEVQVTAAVDHGGRLVWKWSGTDLCLLADALWHEAEEGKMTIPTLSAAQARRLALPLTFDDGFRVMLETQPPMDRHQAPTSKTGHTERLLCHICKAAVLRVDMREHIARHILKQQIQPNACGFCGQVTGPDGKRCLIQLQRSSHGIFCPVSNCPMYHKYQNRHKAKCTQVPSPSSGSIQPFIS